MIFASSQILCLLALGATLVMLTRNIDVSVGSTVYAPSPSAWR